MSVIGPRPALWNQDVLIAEREKYNANDVKPGLTGWAQINGRDELEIPVKAKLDGEYVEKESLFFDIKCFLGTIGKVAKDDSVVEGGTGEMGKQEISEEIKENEKKKILVDIISDVNMAYSEHARRYLADCGLPKERTYVTGSPMAEVLHDNLEKIEASDVHARLGLEKGKYILLSAHREENIDTEKAKKSVLTS